MTLHVPFVDLSMMPVDMAVVFKPMPGKTAVLMSLVTHRHESMMQELMALGEPLAPEMFCA